MKKSSSILLSLLSGLSFTALEAQHSSPRYYGDDPYGPDTLMPPVNNTEYDDVYYEDPPVYQPYYWVNICPQFDFSYWYYNPYWRPYIRPYVEWPYGYYGRRGGWGWYGQHRAGYPYPYGYGPRRGYTYRGGPRPMHGRPAGGLSRPSAVYGRPGYSTRTPSRGGYSRPGYTGRSMSRGGFGRSGGRGFSTGG
ncbi:MAG TPA: hypothetical protein VNZ86_16940 [Bacteroidia bacterium]|jgi:hypothetical protein|nr:hypothetical protein [Bacteroidia bacterium]